MKKLKNIKMGDRPNKAIQILEQRPNIYNVQRKTYNDKKARIYALPHNYYRTGFQDGYEYAIRRLMKHLTNK